ncbi:Uma2 family endonuclease [Streptomyces sp. 8L]|nr:Uma2 family endonuclease [Streptomyces sp. 8L]
MDFPADENSAPDFAILREDAQRQGKRYGFEDVLLIAEVVSVSSARKDYDDCTAKYGRYGIPIYMIVDPYAAEVVVHTDPTGAGYVTARTHGYGTGKLPIDLADGRIFTLDLDELPRPEPESR